MNGGASATADLRLVQLTHQTEVHVKIRDRWEHGVLRGAQGRRIVDRVTAAAAYHLQIILEGSANRMHTPFSGIFWVFLIGVLKKLFLIVRCGFY